MRAAFDRARKSRSRSPLSRERNFPRAWSEKSRGRGEKSSIAVARSRWISLRPPGSFVIPSSAEREEVTRNFPEIAGFYCCAPTLLAAVRKIAANAAARAKNALAGIFGKIFLERAREKNTTKFYIFPRRPREILLFLLTRLSNDPSLPLRSSLYFGYCRCIFGQREEEG